MNKKRKSLADALYERCDRCGELVINSKIYTMGCKEKLCWECLIKQIQEQLKRGSPEEFKRRHYGKFINEI